MTSLPAIQKKKTIVVVEDDDDFRWLVLKMLAGLEGAAVEIVGAPDGRSAIRLIQQCSPDLVILDLGLPDMNGWEVFMAMREEPGSARIPVIILSSEGTRIDRSFGLQVAQVHDYLVKPCLPSRLRQSVIAALSG
jgi:two-component system, OmpR family, phosphate regulon response regulator PhoB